ncbi:vesicular glutamate transporter 2.2-like [Liolophura sinensis]|uniref:vesicular glutamate transporter 2.2-like n=1 Tax=Liolophura sinensis TaxID=3198878 RepID=UPI003158C898
MSDPQDDSGPSSGAGDREILTSPDVHESPNVAGHTEGQSEPTPSTGQGCSCYIPRRYIMIGMICMGMTIIHAIRVNLAVTVITLLDIKAHEKLGTIEAISNLPTDIWDPSMAGIMHSMFYIGFFCTHIPGGFLSKHVPCHRLFGGCILISSSLNLLIPVAISNMGYKFTLAIRFCQGLSEGPLFPSCYGLLRQWTTPQERGRLGSTVLTGAYAGAVIGFPVAGFITHYIGWQYVYHVTSGVAILWYIIWLFGAHERPSHHPSISNEELTMIEKRQGATVIEYENEKIPWASIFTSLPVISLCVCNIARNFVFILMLTNEPYYLNAFNYSIAENGMLSSIPHILMTVVAFSSGYIADCLMKDNMLNATVVRKLLTCGGFGVEAICFFVLGFQRVGKVVMIFLSLGIGFSGLTVSGWQINHYDLAARYASILVSLSSALGTLGAIASPLVAGHITNAGDKDLIFCWHIVFFITSGVLAFAVIFYAIFGSGEPQPWSEPPPGLKLVQKNDPMARKPYVPYLQTVPLTTLNPDKDSGGVDADRKSYGATAATENAKGYGLETSEKKGLTAT